jgi:hypothetical protein
MSDYGRESGLVAYCGIYCWQCDYYTGNIRNTHNDPICWRPHDNARKPERIRKQHGIRRNIIFESNGFWQIRGSSPHSVFFFFVD